MRTRLLLSNRMFTLPPGQSHAFPVSHILNLAAALTSLPMQAKPIPPTPNDADIPKPVAEEVGLAGASRPDIARFLKVRTAGAPSLSPDGTRLSFRTSITGTPQIWTVPSAGGWPEQITFGEPITTHTWSPDGEWILYGCDRSGNEREGYYLVAPDGSKERELLAPSEVFRAFGGFSRDSKRIAYSTTGRTPDDFDVHILDLSTGEDRRVLEGKGGLYVAAWRPDGGALVLTETKGEDANELSLLDLTTGKAERILEAKEPSAYGDVSWRPDGSGFYLTTDHDRDFRGLAFYEVATRALSWIEAPQNDVEACELSHDGRWLAWVVNEGGASVVRMRDLTEKRDLTIPNLPEGMHGIHFSPRSPVLAITTNGPRVPGDIWIFDPRTGKTARATSSSTAGLDLTQCVIPQHVDIPARDGIVIHGLLYLPKGGGAKPPVLMSVHGGPTAQARPNFAAVHQYLLTRGIAILDLNFRGSTGYGKAFARLDNLRNRPKAVLDMADALEWLRKDGRVDASRAAVMGGSYGGYLTYAAVTQLPDLFRCGVSMVGVSNWITALEGASPQLKASDRLEYGNIEDPEDRKFFEQLSPITHIKNLRSPIMVIHGANDPRDPVSESDQFVRAVRELGGEVEYLRFPDEGHGIRKLTNRMITYRRVAAFLERMLKPGA